MFNSDSRTSTHTRQTAEDPITQDEQTRCTAQECQEAKQEGMATHLGGINTSHDRHSHIHQQHIKLTHSILPHTTFHSIHSFLPIRHHFHSHAQAGQHHLGYSLVDQVVLSQQNHPSLQVNTPDQEQHALWAIPCQGKWQSDVG
jgi:hypothetical protein